MTVDDADLLDEFRRKPRCEWCNARSRHGLDPHHVFARGMGGGGRLDVRINLVSLCRTCHGEVHGGRIMRRDLLAIVAAREGMLQDDVEREIYRLRRLPKGATEWRT